MWGNSVEKASINIWSKLSDELKSELLASVINTTNEKN